MLVFSLISLVICAIAALKLLTLRDPLGMLITIAILVVGGTMCFDFAPLALKSIILVALMVLGGGLL